jgi:hypothetical protein
MGLLPVTVSGAIAGWQSGGDRYGSMDLARPLPKAIEYAENGLSVYDELELAIARHFTPKKSWKITCPRPLTKLLTGSLKSLVAIPRVFSCLNFVSPSLYMPCSKVVGKPPRTGRRHESLIEYP